MRAALIAFSERGMVLGRQLQGYFAAAGGESELSRCESGGLTPWTAERFDVFDALVYIGSCGIAVRAIAPFVKSKTSDPAVLVVDEQGTYVVSLLSGHIGGANEMTANMARWLHAIPVVTTATDVNGVFAVDTWARRQGLAIFNPERIKWISARFLAGETVRFKSLFPVEGELPPGMEFSDGQYDVLVTYRTRGQSEALRLVPPVVTLGVGCKKGISADALEDAFAQVLKKANCMPIAVKQVCSIDMKAGEPGLLEFCLRHRLPFVTYSAVELAAVPGNFAGSPFVRSVTGVDNVCERAAAKGSGEKGRLLTGKDAGGGITMALAIEPFTVRFG